MADATGNNEIREWARAQGITVSARGQIRGDVKEQFYAAYPDRRPAGAVALLPGPDAGEWDDDSSFDDIGLLEPEGDAEPAGGPRRYQAVPDEPEAVSVDPEPAHADKKWRRHQERIGETPAGRGRAPSRMTRAVRTDITAKISFALMVPGSIWKARDPLCGGTFTEQVPEIADAFTDIVCDSPDLIAFFSGPGGNFMKALKVGAALMPVLQVVAAHHVYHTAELAAEDYQQPGYEQGYAA